MTAIVGLWLAYFGKHGEALRYPEVPHHVIPIHCRFFSRADFCKPWPLNLQSAEYDLEICKRRDFDSHFSLFGVDFAKILTIF